MPLRQRHILRKAFARALMPDPPAPCKSERTSSTLSPRFLAVKQLPQFHFRFLQWLFCCFRQMFSRPVDIKVQHRHGRLERRAFSAHAFFRRTLQRTSDLCRISVGKYSLLEVERITGRRYPARPFTATFLRPGFFPGSSHNTRFVMLMTAAILMLRLPDSLRLVSNFPGCSECRPALPEWWGGIYSVQ